MHLMLRQQRKALAAFLEAEQGSHSRGIEEGTGVLSDKGGCANDRSIGHRAAYLEAESQDRAPSWIK